MIEALPGTVICGTLRTEDLINAFVDFLNQHEHPAMSRFSLIAEASKEDEHASWFLHEDLFPAMDDLSPEGHYFGAHPGDGSDFGYWRIEED